MKDISRLVMLILGLGWNLVQGMLREFASGPDSEWGAGGIMRAGGARS
jgi:hypothetical protein